jgi:ribosome-interacting GTPase 1
MEILQEELSLMKIGLRKEAISRPEEGWIFPRALLVGNKCEGKDGIEGYHALEARFKDSFAMLPISAKEEMNLEDLKKEIYTILDIIRIYTKAPGEEPDLEEAVILKKGSTIEDVAFAIHKDFAHKLRYARIWGSGKFSGQMVKKDYQVSEGDIIELHI